MDYCAGGIRWRWKRGCVTAACPPSSSEIQLQQHLYILASCAGHDSDDVGATAASTSSAGAPCSRAPARGTPMLHGTWGHACAHAGSGAGCLLPDIRGRACRMQKTSEWMRSALGRGRVLSLHSWRANIEARTRREEWESHFIILIRIRAQILREVGGKLSSVLHSSFTALTMCPNYNDLQASTLSVTSTDDTGCGHAIRGYCNLHCPPAVLA